MFKTGGRTDFGRMALWANGFGGENFLGERTDILLKQLKIHFIKLSKYQDCKLSVEGLTLINLQDDALQHFPDRGLLL